LTRTVQLARCTSAAKQEKESERQKRREQIMPDRGRDDNWAQSRKRKNDQQDEKHLFCKNKKEAHTHSFF
jgi:hypothetical protein